MKSDRRDRQPRSQTSLDQSSFRAAIAKNSSNVRPWTHGSTPDFLVHNKGFQDAIRALGPDCLLYVEGKLDSDQQRFLKNKPDEMRLTRMYFEDCKPDIFDEARDIIENIYAANPFAPYNDDPTVLRYPDAMILEHPQHVHLIEDRLTIGGEEDRLTEERIEQIMENEIEKLYNYRLNRVMKDVEMMKAHMTDRQQQELQERMWTNMNSFNKLKYESITKIADQVKKIFNNYFGQSLCSIVNGLQEALSEGNIPKGYLLICRHYQHSSQATATAIETEILNMKPAPHESISETRYKFRAQAQLYVHIVSGMPNENDPNTTDYAQSDEVEMNLSSETDEAIRAKYDRILLPDSKKFQWFLDIIARDRNHRYNSIVEVFKISDPSTKTYRELNRMLDNLDNTNLSSSSTDQYTRDNRDLRGRTYDRTRRDSQDDNSRGRDSHRDRSRSRSVGAAFSAQAPRENETTSSRSEPQQTRGRSRSRDRGKEYNRDRDRSRHRERDRSRTRERERGRTDRDHRSSTRDREHNRSQSDRYRDNPGIPDERSMRYEGLNRIRDTTDRRQTANVASRTAYKGSTAGSDSSYDNDSSDTSSDSGASSRYKRDPSVDRNRERLQGQNYNNDLHKRAVKNVKAKLQGRILDQDEWGRRVKDEKDYLRNKDRN